MALVLLVKTINVIPETENREQQKQLYLSYLGNSIKLNDDENI